MSRRRGALPSPAARAVAWRSAAACRPSIGPIRPIATGIASGDRVPHGSGPGHCLLPRRGRLIHVFPDRIARNPQLLRDRPLRPPLHQHLVPNDIHEIHLEHPSQRTPNRTAPATRKRGPQLALLSERRLVYFLSRRAQHLRTYDGLADGAGGSGSLALSSPDGKYFAWLGMGQLQLWDMTTGAQVALPGARPVTISDRPPGGPERKRTEQQVAASAAEFLNDGRLAYVDDYRAVILTLPNGPLQEVPVGTPKTERSGHVRWSPSWLRIRRDGRLLAGTTDSHTILWDIAATNFRNLIAPPLTHANSLQWSRSGVVAWGDFQSGVRAWNDRTGEPVDSGSDINFADALAFHPDGQRLAVSGSSSIDILDLQRRRAVSSLQVPPATRTGVAFSPDGSRLAFASSEGLAIFDVRLRQQARLARLEEYTSAECTRFQSRWALDRCRPGRSSNACQGMAIHGVCRCRDARYQSADVWSAAACIQRRFALARDLQQRPVAESLVHRSWALERTWSLPGTGHALAFAPRGPRLAVAGDGEAAISDANTGRKLVTLSSPGSSQAREIAWSPDGNRVVTSADDGVLRFWNAVDGRLLASLFTLASTEDWLLVAADGRLDGSERALTSLVAWRVGNRVALNKAVTDRQRVRGLWRSLTSSPAGTERR